MKKILVAFVIGIVSFQVQSQTINSASSRIEFEIGTMAFLDVEGTIKGMKGKVKFNPSDLANSSFDVTVNPASIDTDNEKRDVHLKNEDFFDIEKYLTVHFKSTSIKKVGDEYITKGYLTLHGIKKLIDIPFKVSKNASETTLEGEIEINRFDYNLGSEEYTTTTMVGKKAEVKIICVLK